MAYETGPRPPGRTIPRSTAKTRRTRRFAKEILLEDPCRGGFLVVTAFVYLRALRVFVVCLWVFPHAAVFESEPRHCRI